MNRRTVKITAVKEYPIPVSKLWELLCHTELLHASIPLVRVQYQDFPEGAYHFYRNAKPLGVLSRWIHWQEYPYEWVWNKRIRLYRTFTKGPILKYSRMIELEETPHGTRVRVSSTIITKRNILTPLIKRRGRRWIRGVHRYCDSFFAVWIQRQKYVRPRKKQNVLNMINWNRKLKHFVSSTEHGETMLKKLKQFLTDASDYELTQLKPKDLAEAWGVDPYHVVRLFLYAVSEGLLQFQWTLRDPYSHCRKIQRSRLADIPNQFWSDESQKEFPTILDRNLELRFAVSPYIRKIPDLGNWEVGPGQHSHIWVKQYLPPGGKWSCELEMGEEIFRARTLRTNQACELNPTGGTSSKQTKVELVFTGTEWSTKEIVFRPGKQKVSVENASKTPIYFILERTGKDSSALFASQVFAIQEFHQLFKEEKPPIGAKWRIRHGVYLVLSLKGSAAYFSKLGDTKAINNIHHLMSFVASHIKVNQGSVLNLLGDTVFCLFSDPDKAVRCALNIQRQMVVFNEAHQIRPHAKVRISIHSGPAISLFRMGRLDLVGESINQVFQYNRLAEGEDLVCSKSVYDDPRVKRFFSDQGFEPVVLDIDSETVRLAIGSLADKPAKVG